MHFQSGQEIYAIGQGLLDRTLPKAAWLLAARPDIDAPAQMPDIIRAYNDVLETSAARLDRPGPRATAVLGG